LATIEHPVSSPIKPEIEDPNYRTFEQQNMHPANSSSNARHNNFESDGRSLFGSIRSQFSRLISPSDHRKNHDRARQNETDEHHESDSSGAVLFPAYAQTTIFDPSINVNPLVLSGDSQSYNQSRQVATKKGENRDDVSKHIFYIVNSQMRLKLNAKNEVCLVVTFPRLATELLVAFNAPMDYCT